MRTSAWRNLVCRAKPLGLCFVAAAFSIRCLPAGVLSNVYANPANGHAYFMLDADSWAHSEIVAQQFGGHLASVNDVTENEWLFRTFGQLGRAPRTMWIGFTDQLVEGQFVWTSGESVTYTNWAPGEPNGDAFAAGSDYTQLAVGHFGQIFPRSWNDNASDSPEPDYGVVEISHDLLPGDTNADGVVDLMDLNHVRNHFGRGAVHGFPVFGEAFPFDGVVDLADLNTVRNAFGSSAVSNVPEPSSVAVLASTIAALLFLAHRAC